jgi:hypothetical protein
LLINAEINPATHSSHSGASISPPTSGYNTIDDSPNENSVSPAANYTSLPSAVSPQTLTLDHRNSFYDLVDIHDENEESMPTTDESLSGTRSGSQHLPLEHVAQNTNQEEDRDFEFFLSEISKCFPYVGLFPWAAARLFATSNHNPALRESVLSVAALIADDNLEKGRSRALHHLHKALQILQSKIGTVEIDEGLAISSFLLAHFSVTLGDYVTAKTHLKGMVMVLGKLDPESMRESVLSPLTIDPLTMLIWRMAKRIDFIISIVSGEPPVLPRCPSTITTIKTDVLVSHRHKNKSTVSGYSLSPNRMLRPTGPIGPKPGLH